MTKDRKGAKERIVESARNLFYQEGFRAVSADTVIEAAGVAKTTFYKYFPTKDDLILEVVHVETCAWFDAIKAEVNKHVDTPQAQPAALFDAVEAQCKHPNFRGCLHINVAIELADKAHPAVQAATAFRQTFVDYIAELLQRSGHENTTALAEQFGVLVEGGVVGAQLMNNLTPVKQAKRAALELSN